MREKTISIEIPLIMPGLEQECGSCLDRIQHTLQEHKGVLSTHLDREHEQPILHIHYQPDLISLETVRRITRATGLDLVKRYRHESIPLQKLDNADQVPGIRRALENLPGMLHARVNYAAGLAFVAYEKEKLNPEKIASTLRKMGVRPVNWPAAAPSKTPEKRAAAFLPRWIEERFELVLVGVTGILILLGWGGDLFWTFPDPLPRILLMLAYLSGGISLFLRAVPGIFQGNFDTDVLMLAAAGGAAVLDKWAEGAFLLFLFNLGHAGEHYALNKARTAVNALGELLPQTARVRREGEIQKVPVKAVNPGEQVLVRPGERIPVDGKVISGESLVDQSPITGESVPVQKIPGGKIFAGSVNQDQSLEIEVTRTAEDNTLARVMDLVAEAQSQQSPTQRFTDRFTSWFVPAVLILTLLVITVPSLAGWMPFQDSFYRAMLLLVAASPCALALGTPAAVLTGIAQAARNGVLIKGGVHLENLGRIQVLALDKTGTLTEGKFQITDLIPLNGTTPEELLRTAAAVETESNHPLAAAVVDEARARSLTLPAVGLLENFSGRGVGSEMDGQRVLIGTLDLHQEKSEHDPGKEIGGLVKRLEEEGKTTMTVRRGETYLGVIALADISRTGVKETLTSLLNLGIKKIVMLTGDNRQAAEKIGKELAVTDIRSNLLPADKLTAVKELEREYGEIGMIGDGINDAPALAAATVGIAMGGAGTAAALETADIALMADDLSKLPFAVGLSRASRRVIQQNLVIALGVIALLILSSVLGWFPLGWAVVFHEGSSIAVVLNALRLLRFQGQ